VEKAIEILFKRNQTEKGTKTWAIPLIEL